MAGAKADLDLLVPSALATLGDISKREAETVRQMEISGATRLINALRIFRIQRAVLAVGTFSLYEALLQDDYCFDNPFKQLPDHLEDFGEQALSQRFRHCHAAINVLKHGKGSSLQGLLNSKFATNWMLKPDYIRTFFEEGDLNEGDLLIYVDEEFVMDCLNVIQDTLPVIRRTRNVEKDGNDG